MPGNRHTRKRRGGSQQNVQAQSSKSTVEHLQENLKNVTGLAKEKLQQLIVFLMGLVESIKGSQTNETKNIKLSKPKQQLQVGSASEKKVEKVDKVLLPKSFQQRGGKKSRKKRK